MKILSAPPLCQYLIVELLIFANLPYDSAIPFLGIHPEKPVIWKDTGIPMFTAALFTITKTWKQSKCPSTEEWIKRIRYIYTMGYYIAPEKNEMISFITTQMDLEIVILNDLCKTEKYHKVSLIGRIKKCYKRTYLQNRNRLTDLENEFMVARGKDGSTR